MRHLLSFVVVLGLASCGSDSNSTGSGGSGGSAAGGSGGQMMAATGGSGGSGGAAGKGGAGGSGGSSSSAVPTNFGQGGWDCAVGSDCGCTHSPGTKDNPMAMCPAKFTCCELISISSGLSWYCNCYTKTDAECQAEVMMKNSPFTPVWKVPACPPAMK